MPKPTIQVFSSGGGTQSSAISALIVQGKLPKPDFVVIADTGLERASTWAYLDQWVRPALLSVDVEVHRIQSMEWTQKWATGIFSPTGGSLLIPAFTDQSGEPAKLSAFCSNAWKKRVIDRWLRVVHGVKRDQYRKWIGFSVDELARAARMMRSSEYQRGLIRFPLIQDVQLRRAGSINLVKQMGWPEPPRSACYICSNQHRDEWKDLKENSPEEFSIACQVDRDIRLQDPFAYLHESCVPLKEVDFDQEPASASRACDSGGCFL